MINLGLIGIVLFVIVLTVRAVATELVEVFLKHTENFGKRHADPSEEEAYLDRISPRSRNPRP